MCTCGCLSQIVVLLLFMWLDLFCSSSEEISYSGLFSVLCVLAASSYCFVAVIDMDVMVTLDLLAYSLVLKKFDGNNFGQFPAVLCLMVK